MRGGKSCEAASREQKPDLGPAELDRTLKQASLLRGQAGAPAGSRRPELPSPPPPSPPRRRRGPCVTGGDGAAATGEDAAGAEGGSNAQAPPSPAWMLSQGTQEKKNQQFIERRSYSLSGYPTPTGRRIYSRLSLGEGGCTVWMKLQVYQDTALPEGFFFFNFFYDNKLHNGSTFRQCIFCKAYWEFGFWKALQN